MRKKEGFRKEREKGDWQRGDNMFFLLVKSKTTKSGFRHFVKGPYFVLLSNFAKQVVIMFFGKRNENQETTRLITLVNWLILCLTIRSSRKNIN